MEAWALTMEMDEAINIASLRGYLKVENPKLADLLKVAGSGRPLANCDWNEVAEHGYKTKNNPNGVKGNRRSIRPDFRGDGTQRFQALSALDFTQATAADAVNLIDSSLRYLRGHLPIAYCE